MEIVAYYRVMVSRSWSLLILTGALSLASSTVCPPGKQFLHQELQICLNCTVCDSAKGHVLLRPCEVHRDTICGPLSQLTLDWKFLQPSSENRHRHEHHKHRHEKRVHLEDGHQEDLLKSEASKMASRRGEIEVPSTEMAYYATSNIGDAIIWDWQAIALTLAVFACILFFLVIALYSLHQAKQWRRLKDNFEADVEELSARLSLMAASSSEKGEILEPRLGPVHDGNYLKNRCVYLEQLLSVRKDTKIGSETGNVYIEESNPNNVGKT